METKIKILPIAVAAVLFFMLFGFVRVSGIKDSNGKLAGQLIGEWRNVYLKVIIHHQNDPVDVLEADSSNWEAKLKIHPIRTHFNKDGSYYSEYLNLKDSIVRRPTGIWKAKDDSVIITQLTPDKAVYKFKLIINNDHATFNGNIDFNEDGNEDDVYFGIQKKYN